MKHQKVKSVATVAGAGVGAWVGSSIGIAGFFGAISGAIPLALVGAYAARKLTKGKTAQVVLEESSAAYAIKDLELARKRRGMRLSSNKPRQP